MYLKKKKTAVVCLCLCVCVCVCICLSVHVGTDQGFIGGCIMLSSESCQQVEVNGAGSINTLSLPTATATTDRTDILPKCGFQVPCPAFLKTHQFDPLKELIKEFSYCH